MEAAQGMSTNHIDVYLIVFVKPFIPGEIQKKGIVVPFDQQIYNPILNRLKQEGIRAREIIDKV
jgi:hypothetical protein